MSKDNEKEITEKLKQLPKIADESDKDKLFQQVASRLDSEATPKRKKKPTRYLPILTTAAVLIFVIALPFLLTNMNNQTADDDMKMNAVHEEESSMMESSEDSAEITSFSLEEDKKTDIAFDIQKNIPEEINFEIEIDNEVLIFNLLSDERQNEAELTKTVIESSLMTAKSYGFQYVYFENMPLTELDEYDLSEPIEVQ